MRILRWISANILRENKKWLRRKKLEAIPIEDKMIWANAMSPLWAPIRKSGKIVIHGTKTRDGCKRTCYIDTMTPRQQNKPICEVIKKI